ncbi:MAG: hypothetical protein LQ346_008644 [Caloplaca aetnensis]|nr:MAG: hypothetical protein LQ346_008644 [Caloplaca aetnensis]
MASSSSSAMEKRVRELEEQLAQSRLKEEEVTLLLRDERKLTTPSTFEELLQGCHEQLFQSLEVETDRTLTTKGGTTSPQGKLRPDYLRGWTGFAKQQQDAFDCVYGALYPPADLEDGYRIFLNQAEISGIRKTQATQKVASETDLRLFQANAVEGIVAHVIQQLSENSELANKLGLEEGSVTFANNPNSLRDGAADVQARQQSASSLNNPPVTPPNRSAAAVTAEPQVGTNADQHCVYHTVGGRKRLLFVMEYKAPHKFTKLILRQGFRDMDVDKEVIHRKTIPQDDTGKAQHMADYLAAAASSQTYEYMLEGKCEYGCIVTGESIVFLRLTKEKPKTLEYCLKEPSIAGEDTIGGFQHNETAIAQVLSLFFMALDSKNLTNGWMADAEQRASKWHRNDAEFLEGIPETIRKCPPLSPAYKHPQIPDNVARNSPYYLRRGRVPGKQPRKDGDTLPKNKPLFDDSDSDDPDAPDRGSGNNNPATSTITSTTTSTTTFGYQQGGGKKQSGGKNRGNWESSDSDEHYHRPYCTQKCILGLAQSSALDPACPHVESHRRRGSQHHMVDKRQVCALLQQQLNRSLDFNCTDLQIYGSRSMLFKVTLASYGYTLVAKGTRDVFVVDLMHEQQMYDRLSSMQGEYIPVHVGNIDLAHAWYDCGGVRVIHMLLLAYGGVRIDNDQVGEIRDLMAQVTAFRTRLAGCGVQHGDLADRNILWDAKLQRIMFIDFERSTVDQDGGAPRTITPDRQRDGMESVVVRTQPKTIPCWLDIFDADETIRLPLPSAEEHAVTTTANHPPIPSTNHNQTLTYVPPPLDDEVRKGIHMSRTKFNGPFRPFDIYEDPTIASPPSPEGEGTSQECWSELHARVATSTNETLKVHDAALDKENVVISAAVSKVKSTLSPAVL